MIPGSISPDKLLCSLLILLSLLGGCATGMRVSPEEEARLDREASNLESAGDYRGAAAIYLQQADTLKPPLENDYRLDAASLLLRGNLVEDARAIISGLDRNSLTRVQTQRVGLLRAGLALAENQPEVALDILYKLDEPEPENSVQYHQFRAEAFAMTGKPVDSARERIWLESFLDTEMARRENQLATWKQLSGLSDSDLQQAHIAPPPDTLSGWVELVQLTRLYIHQPDALRDVISQWQGRYPGHPAGAIFIPEMFELMLTTGRHPGQLALLLPLKGGLAGAAGAIRDGFLAAYYEQSAGTDAPEIRIYDVNEGNVVEQYQRAVSDGAGFVVGPLRKSTVNALVDSGMVTGPVLTLNQIVETGQLPGELYQFGLAPEDEARDIARRALADGHRNALAIIPEGTWGDRVFAAFSEEWIKTGGMVLEVQTYVSSETDYAGPIRAALNLDDSEARYQALVGQLGQRPEFEPRRRQDVDFIFLLAKPRQARLLIPQLSFHHAADIPVYATSHVYAGYPDAALDIDLNGLMFCDMPWNLDQKGRWQALQETLSNHRPDRDARYERLFALGMDAYHAIPYLGQTDIGLFGTINGATGKLTMDPQQRLHRQLEWAVFRDGIPAPVGTETGMGEDPEMNPDETAVTDDGAPEAPAGPDTSAVDGGSI